MRIKNYLLSKIPISFRTIILGSSVSLLERSLGMLLGMLSVSILARYLGRDEFGIWAIIGSLGVYIVNLDLGLGNSLRNKLANLDADQLQKEGPKYFLSIFQFLFFLSLLLITTFLIIQTMHGWDTIVKSESENVSSLGGAVICITFVLLSCNLPFSIYTSSLFAFQETHLASLITITQSICFFIELLVVVHLNLGLIYLVTANYVNLLVFSTFGFIYFLRRRRWKFNRMTYSENLLKIKELFSKSVLFFILSITSIMVFTIPPLIVNAISNIGMAGDFSLFQKLFMFLIPIHFALLTPLWSAYTIHAAQNDWEWVKKTLALSTLFTIVYFLISISLIIIMGNQIIYIWTGRSFSNNLYLRIILGGWTLLYGFCINFGVFLNGINKLKIQAILWIGGALVIIPLSYYFGINYGTLGVPLAGIIIMLPIATILSVESFKTIHRNTISNYTK